jgi:hypothetical protein
MKLRQRMHKNVINNRLFTSSIHHRQQKYVLRRMVPRVSYFSTTTTSAAAADSRRDFLESIQRKAETMSAQLKEERKELFAQTRKLTTWAETNEIVWHSGKSLEALPRLISKKKCFIFPQTPKTCYSLATDSHVDISEYIIRNEVQACMVVITFTAFSAEMAKTWIEPFYNTFSNEMNNTAAATSTTITSSNTMVSAASNLTSSSSNSNSNSNNSNTMKKLPPVKMFDLSISSGTFVRFMKNTIMRAMKKSTPEHLVPHTLACYPEANEQSNLDYFEARLDINNSKNCYVFLLDRDARVRWRAVGNSTEKELVTLKKLTIQLLNGE